MSNNLQIFEDDKFEKIRTVLIDGSLFYFI